MSANVVAKSLYGAEIWGYNRVKEMQVMENNFPLSLLKLRPTLFSKKRCEKSAQK